MQLKFTFATEWYTNVILSAWSMYFIRLILFANVLSLLKLDGRVELRCYALEKKILFYIFKQVLKYNNVPLNCKLPSYHYVTATYKIIFSGTFAIEPSN